MASINYHELNNIINHKTYSDHDYIFYNISKEKMMIIQQKLQNENESNIANIIIDFDNKDISKINNIISTIPNNKGNNSKAIWKIYLSTIICKKLMATKKDNVSFRHNPFENEDITLNDNLKHCKDWLEYRREASKITPLSSFDVIRFIINNDMNFFLHFFVSKEVQSPLLQEHINYYIGQYNRLAHLSGSRIYNEDNRLITYCSSTGQFIEPAQDYIEFSFEEAPTYKKRSQ